MKIILFLIFTLISSLGDALFLAGIPLFLYSETKSISFTILVPVVITLTLIASRPFLPSLQRFSPLKLIASGELTMCFLELAILWLYQFFPNPWTIVLGLIPLALVYNTYAGAKFVTLPLYFASNLKPLFAAAHSWCLRIGGLSGALVSGILISKYG